MGAANPRASSPEVVVVSKPKQTRNEVVLHIPGSRIKEPTQGITEWSVDAALLGVTVGPR